MYFYLRFVLEKMVLHDSWIYKHPISRNVIMVDYFLLMLERR